MAQRSDLHIYQGDDYSAVVTVTDADGAEADITGYTARAQIRRQVADTDTVIALDMPATVESPRVLFGASHDDTASLSGSYLWDLELTSPDDVVTTIMRGNVKVTQEITR